MNYKCVQTWDANGKVHMEYKFDDGKPELTVCDWCKKFFPFPLKPGQKLELVFGYFFTGGGRTAWICGDCKQANEDRRYLKLSDPGDSNHQ